jgi:hypothetical protein
MSAAVTTPKRAVLIGSVWRRQDPSRAWMTFEVTSFTTTPYGQRSARGRTVSGKVVSCSLAAMENGDPRFEHVHDDYVGRTQ